MDEDQEYLPFHREEIARRKIIRDFGQAMLIVPNLASKSRYSMAEKQSERREVDDTLRRFGARGDGISSDSTAIQRAIDESEYCWVERGNYLIDKPIILRSNITIEFSSNARFFPAAGGMSIFTAQGLTCNTRIISARIDGNGKNNVTAFELESFRNGCILEQINIQNCERGIVLKSLCWDLVIFQPTIIRTKSPIILSDRSNAVDIFHPAFDGYDTGITIDGSNGEITSTRVWGGYLQNGDRGIFDHASVGTIIYGTYFEGHRNVDIDLKASIHPTIDISQHFERKGIAAIRGRETVGASIRNPIMASGGRRYGLLDFDESNRDGMLLIPTSSTIAINRPIGTRSGLADVAVQHSGRFEPVLAGSLETGKAKTIQAFGNWRVNGNEAQVNVECAWDGHNGRGGAVIIGIPDIVKPQSYKPRPSGLVIAEQIALNDEIIVAQLNGEGTNISLVKINKSGDASLLEIPIKGKINFSISYFMSG